MGSSLVHMFNLRLDTNDHTWILQKSGKASTAFLGGISRNYNTKLLFSSEGNVLIVEADEFDRSFLQIYADVAIITSVDADHLDTYKDKSDLDLAFKQFAFQIICAHTNSMPRHYLMPYGQLPGISNIL